MRADPGSIRVTPLLHAHIHVDLPHVPTLPFFPVLLFHPPLFFFLSRRYVGVVSFSAVGFPRVPAEAIFIFRRWFLSVGFTGVWNEGSP